MDTSTVDEDFKFIMIHVITHTNIPSNMTGGEWTIYLKVSQTDEESRDSKHKRKNDTSLFQEH